MRAVSELFDQTEILCMLRQGSPPAGYQEISGHNLIVSPRKVPPGRGQLRKLLLPFWLVRNGSAILSTARIADAIHAVLLGDIGTLGLLSALVMRKPLFARHCGMWTYSETLAARATKKLLVRIAGGPRVVMATGGGIELPEPGNPSIEWIFATSLSDSDIERMPQAPGWRQGERLRLVSVGRLSAGKQLDRCIAALPRIQEHIPETVLTLVGEGEERRRLDSLARKIGVTDSVDFVGNRPRDEVLEILAKSHVFLFPSAAEGFPKAVLEAMACRLPVVVSGVSVLPHLLDNGRGIVLRDSTSEGISNAVINLIENPDGMVEMGTLARRASRAFTLERWRDLIGERLEAAWGRTLKTPDDEGSGERCPTG